MKILFVSVLLITAACTTPQVNGEGEDGGSQETSPRSVEMPADNSQPGSDPRVETLASGAYARGAAQADARVAPFVRIARSDAEFRSLWNELIASEVPAGFNPQTETAVFLVVPSRPTGGYSVQFRKLEIDGGTARIHADLIEPAPDAMVTQAFTAPYLVLTIADRSFTRVEWMNRDRLLAQQSIGQ